MALDPLGAVKQLPQGARSMVLQNSLGSLQRLHGGHLVRHQADATDAGGDVGLSEERDRPRRNPSKNRGGSEMPSRRSPCRLADSDEQSALALHLPGGTSMLALDALVESMLSSPRPGCLPPPGEAGASTTATCRSNRTVSPGCPFHAPQCGNDVCMSMLVPGIRAASSTTHRHALHPACVTGPRHCVPWPP